MFKTRVQQLLATFVVAALVLSSVATFASAAPAAQVRSQTVTGTIPGTAPPCDSRDIGRGEVSGGVASASPGIRASTSAQKARLIPPPR